MCIRDRIQSLHDELIKPKTAFSIFKTPVAKLHIWDTVQQSIERLKELGKRYAPVFEENTYKWTFSEHTLFQLLTTKGISCMSMSLAELHIWAIGDRAKFIDSNTSIYELEPYFEWAEKSQLVYMSVWGKKDAQIEWVISIHDVPTINDHFLQL